MQVFKEGKFELLVFTQLKGIEDAPPPFECPASGSRVLRIGFREAEKREEIGRVFEVMKLDSLKLSEAKLREEGEVRLGELNY